MKRKCTGNLKHIALAALAALALSAAMSAGAAALIGAGWVGEEWVHYMTAAVLVLASFGAGAMGQNAMEAAGAGLGFWLLLLGIHAFGYGTALHGAGETLLAIVGGAGCAALFKGRKKSGSIRRRTRRIVKFHKISR